MKQILFKWFDLYLSLNLPWQYHNYFEILSITTHGKLFHNGHGVWKYGINIAVMGFGFEVIAQESMTSFNARNTWQTV